MAASFEDLTAKVDAGERLTNEDMRGLASTRDIIALGMLASTVRRRLRGNEVTYVRVADLKVSTTSDTAGAAMTDAATGVAAADVATTDVAAADVAATEVAPTFRSAVSSAGEIRVFQTPHSLDAAVAVVERARDIARDTPLSAFCLYELGKLPEGLPVVLAALKKAGLNTITQAPIDRLKEPERALESMTDAGLELARLKIGRAHV